jgi:hypothetical protein
MKTFVVTVDSYYLRGTLVFKPDGVKNIPDAESREHMLMYLNDKNWSYIRKDAFLGIYEWDETDIEGLKLHAAKTCGLCPELICTIEV